MSYRKFSLLQDLSAILRLGLDAAVVCETNKGDNKVLGGAVHPQGQVHPLILSLTDVSGAVLAGMKTVLGPLTAVEYAKLHLVKWENKEEKVTGMVISYH